MKSKEIKEIKIYNQGSLVGYDSKDIYRFMKSMGKGREWSKWIDGSTGMIVDGHFVVYKSDVDRFIEGLPNND